MLKMQYEFDCYLLNVKDWMHFTMIKENLSWFFYFPLLYSINIEEAHMLNIRKSEIKNCMMPKTIMKAS